MNMLVVIPVVAGLLAGQPGASVPAEKAKAPAGAPRVLVMKDLSRRAVRLVSLGAESVQIVGVRGSRSRPMTVPRRDVLAVLLDESGAGGAAPAATAGPGEAWLKTVEGEVLAGRLGEAPEGAKAGETLLWQTQRLGDLVVKLDGVASVEFAPASAEAGAAGKAGEDRVLLANGDVLSGFLEALGPDVLMDVGGQKRAVPLSGVARVEMSNAAKPLAGPVVWLTGGEVLRVARVSGTASETTVLREGKPVTVPTGEVAGYVEDAAALRPLAGVPAAVAPWGARSWAGTVEVGDRGVPLGAADVTLPSPMVVTWALPSGAVRVSARVVLPAACRVWGNCVVVVEQMGEKGVGGKELARFHLSGDAPEAELNAELLSGGGPLRVTLEEGENGPIQDRVTLRQPLVLIGR